MNSRHKATLAAIFEQPTRADIPWRSIEALFLALGAVVSNGAGSRCGAYLNGRHGMFHEPHPEKVTDKGAIKSVRNFLTSAGVKP